MAAAGELDTWIVAAIARHGTAQGGLDWQRVIAWRSRRLLACRLALIDEGQADRPPKEIASSLVTLAIMDAAQIDL